MDEGFVTAAQLARQLRVDGKRLRSVIRKYDLVPAHDHGKHYRLDAENVAWVTSHAAVRELPRDARFARP